MSIEPTFLSSNPLGALKRIQIENFTVFDSETFVFSEGINIVVGENGTGKSHLLKLAYSASKALYPSRADRTPPGKEAIGKAIADKLIGVFVPDNLGRLARRGQGRQTSEITLEFQSADRKMFRSLDFSFSTNSTTNVKVGSHPVPPDSPEGGPIFLPTREMISLSPDFVRDYTRFSTRFDETYYDLSVALMGGLSRGKRPSAVDELVAPLEAAMNGVLSVEKGSGRVYLTLKGGGGKIEMPLLAEGIRKMAMLAFLILNGSLTRHGTIFWDEPETNLNPKLMVGLAEVLVGLAASGVQLIIATHSLFLMREIALQLDGYKKSNTPPVKYFSLAKEGNKISKKETDNIDDLTSIPALEAALVQDEALERQYWNSRDE